MAGETRVAEDSQEVSTLLEILDPVGEEIRRTRVGLQVSTLLEILAAPSSSRTQACPLS